MAKYWVAHSHVDEVNGQPDSTGLFAEHGIWYSDSPTAHGKVEQISIGDFIALKHEGRIWAIGKVGAFRLGQVIEKPGAEGNVFKNSLKMRVFFFEKGWKRPNKKFDHTYRTTLTEVKDESIKKELASMWEA